MKKRGRTRLGMTLLCGVAISNLAVSSSFAQPPPDSSQEQLPVDLTADRLLHDEEAQIISAAGNVELVQGGRILKAEEIIYSLDQDRVIARGDVVLNDENGDVHFADYVELTSSLRSGFVRGLRSLLADGSRFAADEGERIDGTKTVMTEASYTPCEPCEEDPDKPPIWQITADEVIHDEKQKRISYRNAKFEVWGAPVAWTPYFSHPDGTVKQKSGFLTPLLGYDSELGGSVESRYYWAIGPDRDATFGIRGFTQEAPLVTGEYRQRWANATFAIRGSATYSGRTDSIAGEDVKIDEETRGHVEGEGKWDVNEHWRTGFNIDYASDDQYLRQYDISSEDVLENEVYAERFSGRNYAEVRAIAFQDVRIGEERVADQPNIIPEARASFYGQPGRSLGGRWHVEASVLGLQRQGSDQDVTRGILYADWERRFIHSAGLATTVNLGARGDAYHTSDRTRTGIDPTRDDDETEYRSFARAHIVSGYPLVKQLETSQVVIEPKAALTLSPDVDDDLKIPNEDSQDVQIDSANLFQPNRFPGYDRIEDQSRVTYGLSAGVYGYDGSYADVFVGQSYRFEEEGNPFPRGSGLSERESDIVGQVSANYQDRFNLNYRFQLGAESVTSRRHEVDAYARWRRLQIDSSYLYARALEGTDIDESREQLQAGAAYFVSDHWRARVASQYDLGAEPGLRRAEFGLDYFGQCVNVYSTVSRELTREATGDSGTEIMFRIGLKNLGEFQTSGLDAPGGDETEE